MFIIYLILLGLVLILLPTGFFFLLGFFKTGSCFEKQHTHKIVLPGEDSSLYNFESLLDEENTKLLIENKSQHII